MRLNPDRTEETLAWFRRLCSCAIYTRQSRGVEGEFSSCEAQFEACLAFVKSQFDEGWVWNGQRYDDEAESSETLDRPGLKRLLEDVRQRRIGRVVVHRLDRLSRRILDCTEFLNELKERGIPLTIVTQPELGITAEHTLVLNLMASFAQFEQEMIRERLAEARAAHKRRGRRIAGVVPHGYEADPVTKQLLVVKREARQVRAMFRMAADGKNSREIAEIANRRRWRTKQRVNRKTARISGGGRWTPRQVLGGPVEPRLCREGRVGGRTRSGIHEGVVDRELFERVQAAIQSRRTRTPGRTKATWRSWLRGLLRCGRCGRPMTPSSSRLRNLRYHYYRCRLHAGGKPPCRGIPVPEMEIELYVSELLGSDTLEADARTDYLK